MLMELVYQECANLTDSQLNLSQAHWMFEKVHPFSDGNGRVGRLILFKECLRLDTIPPLIRDEHHNLYVRALDKYPDEPAWLTDLIGSERDAYRDIFIRKMAPTEIDYSYNESWDVHKHANDLERARAFKEQVDQLAQTARDNQTTIEDHMFRQTKQGSPDTTQGRSR